MILIEHRSKLWLTTWMLGTSIIFTTISCYVIFLVSMQFGAGILGMVFAYLLPVVVVDPRKELRGTTGCFSWWAIALFVTIVYLQMDIILLSLCLLVSISVSILIFQIHRKAMQSGINLRRNKGSMRVRNSAIIIALYFAVASLLFAIAWYLVVGLELVVVILAVQSFTSWCYVFYFWNWSIRIGGNSVTVVRFFQEREYTCDNINTIRKVPLGYYLAINEKKLVIFCFSMRMEQSPNLWMVVRSKVKGI